MSRKAAVHVLLPAVLLALATTTSAWGQTGANEYRIGVVDLKAVFDAYTRQEDEYAALETEKNTRQVVIDKLSDKIEKAKTDYDKRKDTMSDEERDALEEEIRIDFEKYQADFERLQREIDRKEKKLLEDLFQDIRASVQEVGAQGNYHLILEGGESGRSGVLYSSTTLNVTGRVIDHLNMKYKKS